MKPPVHIAFTLIVTLGSAHVNAQRDSTLNINTQKDSTLNINTQKDSALNINARNSIALKFAPLALSVGKLAVGAELQTSKTKSLTIMVGIPIGRSKTFSGDKGNTDVSTKTASILAGYRMYFSKHGGMKGFYFEPYLKYMHNKSDGEYTDTRDSPPSVYDVKSEYSGGGVGAQLGVQFVIIKTIVLDLFLLGPEANYSKVDASFIDVTNNIPWTAQDAQDALNSINDAVKDIPIIGDKVETSVNQSTKTVSAYYKGFVPGIRFGFSVGIRF